MVGGRAADGTAVAAREALRVEVIAGGVQKELELVMGVLMVTVVGALAVVRLVMKCGTSGRVVVSAPKTMMMEAVRAAARLVGMRAEGRTAEERIAEVQLAWIVSESRQGAAA